MHEIRNLLGQLIKDELKVDISVELSHPAEKFGDYSTNVAMKVAAKLSKDPRDLALLLADKLKEKSDLESVKVAGPGFINLTLKDRQLWELMGVASNLWQTHAGQEIVLEHTDPNPFKEFHIGHAYSNTIGVAIGKLLQASGAKIHQVSYHGDIGLHIAMAIYGYNNPENKKELGRSYAFGAKAYQDDAEAKDEIESINRSIYSGDNKHISQLYEEGRQKSMADFESIYKRLEVEFEKNYFESDTAVKGMEVVKKHTGSIFKQSEGAVIYDGEKVGLHKRVFITKQGLPTYEAKEIGLAFTKASDYPDADSFIVITANEIDDYFKVLIAAICKIDQSLGKKILHLSHGLVKLPTGKMSSRSGEVKTLRSLEEDLAKAIVDLHGPGREKQEIVIGAMKYEFLKHRIGSDFIFDLSESISLQGNSGPYLQYAHARARAILQKGGQSTESTPDKLEPAERSLARAISHFPEVVAGATAELMPSDVATYLYELAQQFNSFYENCRVIGDPREHIRLSLVREYTNVLKGGLELLNIYAPDHV